nr:50S ribosomal protein L25/general stress protein Ctc [Calditrichia bacterium]NIW95068.1 50S ribosomal protein L25/general stress protein Ctc [Phycisphaerae bacterium]
QLVMKGTPAGEKEGGILSQTIRELEIECMPQYIPESLEVDVSALDIGDAIHVSDLQYDNITILNEPEEMVVQIVVPKMYEELLEAEAAAAEAEEEEMEEPEVIGEEKPEAEEEAEEEQKQEKREE